MDPATPHGNDPPGSISVLRDVVRGWPVVAMVGLVAVTASAIAVSQREDSYTASAKLLITPVAQYDETFLGTSLILDPGDANRTPTTTAELLNSSEIAADAARSLGGGWSESSVDGAVNVRPVGDTNLLNVDATADRPRDAERLATSYARSTLEVRWRTIAQELDDRIAALSNQPGDEAAGEEDLGREISLLEGARQSGRDPTLTLEGTTPAAAVDRMPAGVVLVLALFGGLFLGAVAAVGLELIRRRAHSQDDVLAAY